MISVELGYYFIVTSGYCENGGMVSKAKEALLFLNDDEGLYRQASDAELEKYRKLHPILRNVEVELK